MNPKFPFAVSVAVATTALLTATAALSMRARCGVSQQQVAAVTALSSDATAVAQDTECAVEAAAEAARLTESEPQEGEEALKKVREAARDYIRESLPGSKPDGVFVLPFTRDGDLAWAGVDTKNAEGERATVDLIVRRYVRRNGAVYYRAEGFGRGGRDAVLSSMQQGRAGTDAPRP